MSFKANYWTASSSREARDETNSRSGATGSEASTYGIAEAMNPPVRRISAISDDGKASFFYSRIFPSHGGTAIRTYTTVDFLWMVGLLGLELRWAQGDSVHCFTHATLHMKSDVVACMTTCLPETAAAAFRQSGRSQKYSDLSCRKT